MFCGIRSCCGFGLVAGLWSSFVSPAIRGTAQGSLRQGPYLYPLYKQTLQLPEHVVAALFSTGFISGAVSATFVGNLADRYGRRRACLSFCVIYSLSCLMTLSPDSIF